MQVQDYQTFESSFIPCYIILYKVMRDRENSAGVSEYEKMSRFTTKLSTYVGISCGYTKHLYNSKKYIKIHVN